MSSTQMSPTLPVSLAPIQQIPHSIALKVLQYLDIDSLLNIPRSLVHWNLPAEQVLCQSLKETKISLIPKGHQTRNELYWPKLRFTTFDVKSGEVVFDVVECSPVRYHLKNPRNLVIDQIVFEREVARDPMQKSIHVEYLLRIPISIPLRPQGNLQFTDKKHQWDFFYHILKVSPMSTEVHFTPLTFQCNISFLFPSKNLPNPKFLPPKKILALWRKISSNKRHTSVPILPDPKSHSIMRSALGTKLFIRTKSRTGFIEIE